MTTSSDTRNWGVRLRKTRNAPKLCEGGVATAFFSSNLLFEAAQAEPAAGRYLKWIQKVRKTSVMILDDFALRNYNHEEANTLLENIEERYQKGITINHHLASFAGRLVVFI